MKKKNIHLAVVGVTGMVGRAFLEVMAERNFQCEKVSYFASARSAGQEIFGRRVEELREDSFDRGVDAALFSAGSEVSEKYAPIAAAKGCVVIDNSSFWRMHEGVPLVVPEVNPEDAKHHKGIIANPNCSTIQAVVALWPLHRQYKIKRICYATYQAVSGAGMGGWRDLEEGQKGNPPVKFPHPIYSNCLPQIDVFLENGYTKEEDKMIRETRKIFHEPDLKVTATCVRVPVFCGHSEAINIEFEKPFELRDVRRILYEAPSVRFRDDPEKSVYPMVIDAVGTEEVYVGRVRRDESLENGLNLWVVADNVRKGAALNAVQIAELLF